MSNSKEALEYLKSYPTLKKWVCQCVGCQLIGYKEELPEDIYPGMAAQSIRKLFRPLKIDEYGLCEECSRIKERLEEK